MALAVIGVEELSGWALLGLVDSVVAREVVAARDVVLNLVLESVLDDIAAVVITSTGVGERTLAVVAEVLGERTRASRVHATGAREVSGTRLVSADLEASVTTGTSRVCASNWGHGRTSIAAIILSQWALRDGVVQAVVRASEV